MTSEETLYTPGAVYRGLRCRRGARGGWRRGGGGSEGGVDGVKGGGT